MGTFGVGLGTGEIFNKTEDSAAVSMEGGNATNITPFPAAFREKQVLVAKLVQILIHDNTDIDYHMLVVPRKHLYKGTTNSLVYAISCFILFPASLSHHAISLPLTLFWLLTFTHLSGHDTVAPPMPLTS